MLGSGSNGQNYLINFNSSDWANQINKHLQNMLNQGLDYSKQYNQQAVNAMQDYSNQAAQNLNQGFNQYQALNAPQHLATYNALDAYQNSLGLATPVGGSFQLAQAMNNQVTGQPNTPQQQNQALGYNQGLLQGVQ